MTDADAPDDARVLDSLELAAGARLTVVGGPGGAAAVPTVRGADGQWRRAHPGDGAAEAILCLLRDVAGSSVRGRFTVLSWAEHAATGERPITVDQTNESVIVGDTAMVKWATHLQSGPHPAPRRISVLRDAGFTAMPKPLGLITWQPAAGAETLLVTVDEYLPGAVDGWTWAVDLVTDAARGRPPRSAPVLAAATAVGELVADLHAALAGTTTVASRHDAARWRDAALATLETACALSSPDAHAILRARLSEIEDVLDGLGSLAGAAVIEGHGDLHVGQVLRCAGRLVVTDFDGNPVLPAEERVLPIPAVLDVAGMTQSLAHVVIVARKHSDLDDSALAEVDALAREAFLGAYTHRLDAHNLAELYDPGALRALRLQQVLREIIYAARHLPRWAYVPDAALPALLDERPV